MRISTIMLAKGFGGAERSFVDTSLALASRGHKVLAICHVEFGQVDLLAGVDGIEVKQVSVRGMWDFFAVNRVAKYLKAFKAEVVHTQLKRAAWIGGCGARKAGVPVVSKLHNYVQLSKYKHVNHLICTTPDQLRHVLEQGWPSSRVSIIPNFSILAPVEKKAPAPSTRLEILSYGRYVKKKGFDLLLHAFARLIETGVDAHLSIRGAGEEAPNLEAMIEELGLSDYHVSLGTWVDNVSNALDEADVFVLPSLDEPFGIVVLEAMARGIPIVSTLTEGPKIILDDESAYMVEVGSVDSLYDGLLDAVNHMDKAHCKARNALVRYQKLYYVDAVLPQIEDVYRNITQV